MDDSEERHIVNKDSCNILVPPIKTGAQVQTFQESMGDYAADAINQHQGAPWRK